MKELEIKRCMKCGATVEVLKDCTCENCGIKCCGEQMEVLVPNSQAEELDNHILHIEIDGENIKVSMNHPMEDDHFIEWFALVDDERIGKKFLKPGSKAEVTFPYIKGSKVYAFCNKHMLWVKDIE